MKVFNPSVYFGRLSDVARIEARIFMKFICDNLPLGFYWVLWFLKLQLRVIQYWVKHVELSVCDMNRLSPW
jgi:hypothetical protein